MAGHHRTPGGARAAAYVAEAWRSRHRQLSLRSIGPGRFRRARGAPRRRYLRQDARGRSDRRSGACRCRHGRGGRRSSGGPGYAGHRRGVDGCGGRHRDSAGQRAGGDWLPGHPGPAPACKTRIAGEGQRPARAAHRSAACGIRTSTAAERAADGERRRAVRALCEVRGRPLDHRATRAHVTGRPDLNVSGTSCRDNRTTLGRKNRLTNRAPYFLPPVDVGPGWVGDGLACGATGCVVAFRPGSPLPMR